MAQFWAIHGDEDLALDKNLNFGEEDDDKTNLCERIHQYQPTFEGRGRLERFWTWIQGRTEWLKYPVYLKAGAWLVEADLRARTKNGKEPDKAIALSDQVLRESPVVAQRARAYYIKARILMDDKRKYKEALALCKKAYKMVAQKSELDATRLGIEILMAEIKSLTGEHEEAARELKRIVDLLREYPSDYYIKREARLKLQEVRSHMADKGTVEGIMKELLDELKSYVIEGAEQKGGIKFANEVRNDLRRMKKIGEVIDYKDSRSIALVGDKTPERVDQIINKARLYNLY